jgi:RimJ/RimL family protein N-acetyltransferase
LAAHATEIHVETSYFKRFRMEASLSGQRPPSLPPGYRLVAWNDALIDVHARTKFRAFRDEIDSLVFPCLGDLEGCRRLMREIRGKSGFLPDSSWLIAWGRSPEELAWCGTIQAVCDRAHVGMIQNVGVVPAHRGRGLGAALVRQSMAGMWQYGLRRASLEVTVENGRAVELYGRLGFRRSRTVYKLADTPTPAIGVVAR